MTGTEEYVCPKCGKVFVSTWENAELFEVCPQCFYEWADDDDC